jgi:predicted small lipoprotein YifL
VKTALSSLLAAVVLSLTACGDKPPAQDPSANPVNATDPNGPGVPATPMPSAVPTNSQATPAATAH